MAEIPVEIRPINEEIFDKRSNRSHAELFPLVSSELRAFSHGRGQRMARGAPVYAAAVLDYLTCELLTVVGNAAKRDNCATITPATIKGVTESDEDWRKIFDEISGNPETSRNGIIGGNENNLQPTKEINEMKTPTSSPPPALSSASISSLTTSPSKSFTPSRRVRASVSVSPLILANRARAARKSRPRLSRAAGWATENEKIFIEKFHFDANVNPFG